MEEGKTCTVIGNQSIFPIVLSRNLICNWANCRWSFTCSGKRCFRIGGFPFNVCFNSMRVISAIPWKIHFPEVYPIGRFVPWVLIPLWNLPPCWDEWMLGIGKEAVWDLGEMEDGERRTEKLIEKQMMRIDRFRPLSSRVSVVFRDGSHGIWFEWQQSTVRRWSWRLRPRIIGAPQ